MSILKQCPSLAFPFTTPLLFVEVRKRKAGIKGKEMFTRFKYPIPSRWESRWSLWTISSRNGYLKGAFQVALWQRISLPCRRHKRHRFDSWVGKIPWRRHGYPRQYSCLENPTDRENQWAIVHRVAKSRTQLKWLSTQTREVLRRMSQNVITSHQGASDSNIIYHQWY